MSSLWNLLKNEEINKDDLKELVESFYHSTGIKTFVINEKGEKIITCSEEEGICQIFKDNQYNEEICKRCHIDSCKQSEKIGEAYVCNCPLNLVHIATPIIINRAFKGGIISGPILMDYPDEMFVDDMILKNKLPLSLKSKLKIYIKSVPVVEPLRVRYLSKLLFNLTSNLIFQDKYLLIERNEKMIQQSRISESIHGMKGNLKDKIDYPYDKEKELLIKVKNGDYLGAKAILNELLGYVFLTGGASLEIIKARSLELCTLLSRAAVEGGAALDEIFGLNYKFLNELSKINDIEELCYWTLKVLDRFMEKVFKLSTGKNAEIIKSAINYINTNYMKNITLETVADYIHLNPSYFSSLFKKETGMNFSDYLNKVRIEESKKLLKNKNYSILEISIEVGFQDQSYYSKVFKKITGITPKEYREKL